RALTALKETARKPALLAGRFARQPAVLGCVLPRSPRSRSEPLFPLPARPRSSPYAGARQAPTRLGGRPFSESCRSDVARSECKRANRQATGVCFASPNRRPLTVLPGTVGAGRDRVEPRFVTLAGCATIVQSALARVPVDQ